MHYNTFITAAIAALGLASQAHALTYELFTDGNCEHKLKDLTIDPATCATPSPGWSSMKLVGGGESKVLTTFVANNCAASSGSKGFSAQDKGCLKNFGFVANAASLY